MFFHFVVKLNVLVDFCESCKKSGVVPRFMLSIQHVSEKSASGIFICNALSIMSAIFD